MATETESKILIPTTPEGIAEARARIVQVARSWIGTPYRPCWTRKNVGCDCASFLACVYAEAGLVPPEAVTDLGQYDWALPWARTGGDAEYVAGIAKFAHEISRDRASAGDVVMYRLGRGWSHTAIVVRWPGEIIHALMSGGVCASPGTTGRLAGRAVRFWSVF